MHVAQNVTTAFIKKHRQNFFLISVVFCGWCDEKNISTRIKVASFATDIFSKKIFSISLPNNVLNFLRKL